MMEDWWVSFVVMRDDIIWNGMECGCIFFWELNG